MRIHQDAPICSALLERGAHVVHELRAGRIAWLHLLEGAATPGDLVLTTGDGAGMTAEVSVPLTAREETEILLVDLAELPFASAAGSEGIREQPTALRTCDLCVSGDSTCALREVPTASPPARASDDFVGVRV